MATYENSPFTPNIKGKIGGTSFSNGLGGRTIKNGGRRSNSISNSSAKAKHILTQLQQEWKGLTNNQRAAWGAMATYKPTSQRRNIGRFINGQQFYTLYNYANYYQYGFSQSNPVLQPYNFAQITANLTNSGGQLILNTGVNINESLFFIIGKFSAPASGSQNNPKGGLKQIHLFFNDTNNIDITNAYLKLFGLIPDIGTYVFIEFRLFSYLNTDFTNIAKAKLVVQ